MPEAEVVDRTALIDRICKNHKVLRDLVATKHYNLNRQFLFGAPTALLERLEQAQVKQLRRLNLEPAT